MVRVLLFIGVLALNGLGRLFPSYDHLARLSFAAGDGLMLLLAVSTISRTWNFYGSKYAAVFFFSSIFTLLYNFERAGTLVYLNGLREPMFFFLCLVVVYDIFASEYAGQFEKLFTWFLICFALIQIPIAWVQFRQFGMGDYVGGSFGFGGSGVLTLLLFLICFYAIIRYGSLDDGAQFSNVRIGLFSLLLFPCAINETKVSFVLIAVYLCLFLFSGNVYKSIPILILGLLFVAVLSMFYSDNVQETSNLFDSTYLERYLFYDTRQTTDVPRFQKIGLTFDIMSRDPITLLIGLGFGILAGGNVMARSEFAITFNYLFGSRIYLNTIWIQGGMMAVVWCCLAMFHFVKSDRVISLNMRKMKWFLFIVLMVVCLYADAMLNRFFAGTVAFLALWIERGGIDRADDYGAEIESGLERMGEEHGQARVGVAGS